MGKHTHRKASAASAVQGVQGQLNSGASNVSADASVSFTEASRGFKRFTNRSPNGSRKGIIALVGGVALLVVATAIVLVVANRPSVVAMTVCDYQVREAEFAYGLDAVRNDVIQDTAQEGSSLGGDFWASDAPDSPTAAAVERAIKIVQERYAVYDIATEAGIIDSPSWDAIEERVGSENADREDAMNTGGVVTGLQNFDLSTYVDAEARYIRDSYIANDDNPGMTPNDAQIQSYYDAHEWTISDDGAPAALEDVRSNVIQEYKQTYFEREVERRIQAQDVHTDLAELRSFASEYLSARGEK